MSLLDKIKEKLAKVSLPGTLLLQLDDKKIFFDKEGQVSDDIDDADCVLSLSSQTLESIMDGSLDAMSVYFAGDLTITGDMGVAMTLSKYLKN